MLNEIRHPNESLFCEDHNINESNNTDDEECHINVNNINKTDQMMRLHIIHTKLHSWIVMTMV
jgi:hypothetical protein